MEENVVKKEVDKPAKITKCLNCGTVFEGNFCPNCGQRADVSRFTVSFIFTNFMLAILSNDGGIWITLKSLFTHPGQMMVDILDGKRKSYFSPFPMLALALSLYVLIFTFTGSKNMDYDHIFNDETTEVSVDSEEIDDDQIIVEKAKHFVVDVMQFYADNYATAYFFTIPVFILAARVSFGKKNRKRYNWGEYCIPIVYSLILIVIYRCLVSIVYYFSPDVADIMENWIIAIQIIVFTACFRKMFDFSVVKMLWRSFLALMLYVVFIFTIICLVAIVIIVLFVLANPEYFG